MPGSGARVMPPSGFAAGAAVWIVTTPLVGSTLYVRVDVSDPFGSYDISNLGLSIDGPGVSGDINTTLTDVWNLFVPVWSGTK